MPIIAIRQIKPILITFRIIDLLFILQVPCKSLHYGQADNLKFLSPHLYICIGFLYINYFVSIYFHTEHLPILLYHTFRINSTFFKADENMAIRIKDITVRI